MAVCSCRRTRGLWRARRRSSARSRCWRPGGYRAQGRDLRAQKPLTTPEQLQRLARVLEKEGGLEGAAFAPLEGHGAR